MQQSALLYSAYYATQVGYHQRRERSASHTN